MTRITLDTDTSDCPGAVCKIVADDGRDVLVQSSDDACGVASSFGWNICGVQTAAFRLIRYVCMHKGTDGTVRCRDCGVTPERFREAALDYIAENDGESVDDPGYFDG